jgi:magnesium transporter
MESLKNMLSVAEEMEILYAFNDLSSDEQVIVFRLLAKDTALSVFEQLDTDLQYNLIRSFTEQHTIEYINELADDDRVRLLDELPATVAKRLINSLTPEEREITNILMGYDPETAGRIMTTKLISLNRQMTAAQALEKVRRQGKEMETVYNLYVTDSTKRLEGVISLKDLIMAEPSSVLEDIMIKKSISVHTDTDQEEVAQILRDLDLLAVPVVDKENRIVGICTVDDVIDVIEQETTEDISKMAAITPINKPYPNIGVLEIVKARSPWLLILMISATFTHMIIDSFENAIAIVPVLAAAIPMLMDTAGNAGTQSSMTILRAMSLEEVRLKDLFTIIWKEIRVSVICGIILAIANFGRMLLVSRSDVMVAFVVSVTLVVTVFVAKSIGSALPLLANKVRLDPAVMSATVVTTIADIIALAIYFNIARILLGI